MKESCEAIEVNEVMIESFMDPEIAEEMGATGLPRPNGDLAIEPASYTASGNNDFSYQTLCRHHPSRRSTVAQLHVDRECEPWYPLRQPQPSWLREPAALGTLSEEISG